MKQGHLHKKKIAGGSRSRLTCILSAVAFLLFLAAGCSPSPQKNNVTVTVSILPQKYIVDRITTKSIGVTVMVPPGHSPATYAPTSRQLQSLSASPLYLRIGHIAFEKTEIKKILSVNPKMKIVNTSRNIDLIRPAKKGMNDHHHRGVDPHVWLSPRAMKKIARATALALGETFPEKKKLFDKNLSVLLRDIEKLDREITANLKKTRERRFLVFHPAWGYFARDYNLTQVPIETEGKEPSPRQIQNIIRRAQSLGISTVFIQKQFPTRWAAAIARDLKGRVVRLDPLAPDWLENMKTISATFKRELQ